MKQAFICILLFSVATTVFSQAVGYQGKKFIMQLGFAPANNAAAILADYNLADDYYSSDYDSYDEKDPLIIHSIPKIEMEYVVSRYVSLFFRYHPFKHVSNVVYYDDYSDEPIDILGVTSKGNLFSVGYRSYFSGNIAPLGVYFAIYGTLFKYESAYSESKFGKYPVPEIFLEYPSTEDKMLGLFIEYGVKNIFWDKVILDIQFDAGYFFKNTEEIKYFDDFDQFAPYYLSSPYEPGYFAVVNTRPFFFVTPSVNVGYLLF